MTAQTTTLDFVLQAAGDISEEAAIRRFGGIYFDLNENVFCWVDPTTRDVTSYADFAAMFAALGTITSSTKNIWNADGRMELIPVNTPAQPAYTIGGDFLGINVESAASKNFLLYSEDFSKANWTKTGITLTSNTHQSPRVGTDVTASTITENTGTGNHWQIQSATSLGINLLTYTASIFGYLAAGTRNVVLYVDDNAGNGAYCIFDLANETTEIVSVGTPYTSLVAWLDVAGSTSFFRASLTFKKNAATTVRVAHGMANGTNISYTGDGTSALVVWGAELKQNSGGALAQSETQPTSYVKTTSATVTRAADVISLALPAALRSAAAYSILTAAYLPRAASGMLCVFCSLNSTNDSQRIYLYQANTTFAAQLQAHIDGSGSVTMTIPPANNFGQEVGMAFIAKPAVNWYQSTLKGLTTSTSTAYPSEITKIRLGTYNPATTTVGSHMGVSSLAVFPSAMTRTLMQKLLFSVPFLNPDRITGPNYMSQDMLPDVLPAVSGGYEIFRGPAGIPASDSVLPADYNYFPITVGYVGTVKPSVQTSTCTTAKYAYLQWTQRNNAVTPVTFVGTISGTTLTVTSATGPICGGKIFTGGATGTYITDQPASGDVGTYTVNISQTILTPTTFTQPANLKTFTYNSLPGDGLVMADGSIATLQYTTFDRADAQTYLQSLYVNVYPDRDAAAPPAGQWYNGYLEPVEAIFGPVTVDEPGSRVVSYAYASANRETLFSNRATVGARRWAYSTDIYILPEGQFHTGSAQVWGSVMDFEMSDLRLASRVTPFCQQLALIHHNAATPTKLGLFASPMNGSGKLSGLSGIGIPNKPVNCDVENLGDIATAVDYYNVLVQNPAGGGMTFAESVDLYWAAFGTAGVDFPPENVGFGFVLGTWPGGTTVENAQYLHDFIVANGAGGIQTGPTIGQRTRYLIQKWLTVLGLPT